MQLEYAACMLEANPRMQTEKKWIAHWCFLKIYVDIGIMAQHPSGSCESFRFWSAISMRGQVLASFASSHTQNKNALWAF